VSAKFIPARDTSINTWPSAGSGFGRSTTLSTSGPPNSSIRTALTRRGAYPQAPSIG
jgi:hypothetical protein